MLAAISQTLDDSLLPTSSSIDVAYHLSLVQWITDHGAVPSRVDGSLHVMGVYPFGAHLVAAIPAKLFAHRQPPRDERDRLRRPVAHDCRGSWPSADG